MAWGEILVAGDVNKIGKEEEGKDQGATPSSNQSEIFQEFTRHGITMVPIDRDSGHFSLSSRKVSIPLVPRASNTLRGTARLPYGGDAIAQGAHPRPVPQPQSDVGQQRSGKSLLMTQAI